MKGRERGAHVEIYLRFLKMPCHVLYMGGQEGPEVIPFPA